MKNHKILIVDDEPDMLSTCKAALSRDGISITLESNSPQALKRLERGSFDLIVADIKMPDLTGTELLKAAKAIDPDLPVILMTAYPEVETAVEALRAGALDYLIKPIHPEELKLKVERSLEERHLRAENKLLSGNLEKNYKLVDIIGRSERMRQILELVDKVAATPADVLILGESGTGKELIARMLHNKSRKAGRFVPVDCGAIPENLLENELFGHERGAYTDATTGTPGLLEFAHRGTFFLDEVCDLPLSLQAKFMRALQEREFRRIGGNDLIPVDVRVIAATNKDVLQEVNEGRFREELYYRLNVFSIHLPPLRERADDIPLLVKHYLPRFSREMNKSINSMEDEALEILIHYPWPGNIRELQNVLKKAIILCGGNTLKAGDLPDFLVTTPSSSGNRPSDGFFEFKNKRLHAFEKEYFESLLAKFHGDVKSSAQASSLPLSSFYWYLKKHEIKPEAFRS